MKPAVKAILGVPGTVTIGGRELVVPPQTPGDVARTHDKMRELAARACVSPLAYVNANAEGMAPGVLAEALRAAVAIGSGGGVEPTREAVARAYDSLDGVRWRLWYMARKTEPGLTLADVAALVTESDQYDAADALFAALSPPEAAGPKAPSGGAS